MSVNQALVRMRILLTLLLIQCACSCLLSCKDNPGPSAEADPAVAVKPTPVPAKSEPVVPRQDAAPKTAMEMHFSHAITAKDTVLFGNLTVAAESLHWLAENGAHDGSNESWEPYVGQVRSIAKDALRSKNVDVMAMAVAQLARECGACHAALGVEPAMSVVKEAPSGRDFTDHMIGHKWALDRMWAGLTTPSSELWLSGAKYLAGKPVHIKNLSSYGRDDEAAMKYAKAVHTIATEAVAEGQADRRMAIFGRFLASCAGCHALPSAPPKSH